MDWKLAATIFSTILLAEMGDKTQLLVVTSAASTRKPWVVFAAGVLALALVTALGAFAGGFITRWVPEQALKKGAAVLFVLIGLWTWFKG